MINLISDKNLLDKFVTDFIKILEKYLKYSVVSGFVAISNGRVRGTEDIDIIVEKMSFKVFNIFFKEIYLSNFECVQSDDVSDIFKNYLLKKESIRFVYKGTIVPDIEFKFSKNKVDDYTLRKRVKLPLTGLDIYFATIESTIAYKEHYLCSLKDIEDSNHLRALYSEKLDFKEIDKIKRMIDKHLYNKKTSKLKESVKVNYSLKRDSTHKKFIEDWVVFIKSNSFKVWKKQHSNFLDSQIKSSISFYNRLLKEKDGAKKIRNIKGWNKETPYWFEK